MQCQHIWEIACNAKGERLAPPFLDRNAHVDIFITLKAYYPHRLSRRRLFFLRQVLLMID
jgi:hypothetical protein